MKRWETHATHGLGMDTLFSWNMCGTGHHLTNAMVGEELSRLEGLLSRYDFDSEVARINRSAGIADVEVSDETMEVVEAAIACSKATDGHFDVTVGPLVDLWDILHAGQIPDAQRIGSLLPLVDYRKIRMDHGRNRIGLEDRGASMDLGGIGKGYAANIIKTLWVTHKVTSAFLDLGGNVSTLGNRPDGARWKVGIRHPRIPDSLIAVLQITDTSVVTSGDYERCFVDGEGRRWHHILDPNIGYPSCSDLISATVVHTDAMLADALATAILVMGSKAVTGILEHYTGAQILLVDNKLRLMVTEGLLPHLQPVGENKELIILEDYTNGYTHKT